MRAPIADGGTPVQQATYSLNKVKQVVKLLEDTNNPNYSATYNNSNKNVSIKCSLGFFSVVAQPFFQNISEGEEFQEGMTTLSCVNVKYLADKNGTICHKHCSFKFSQNEAGIGHVSVHMHITTRLVQIQGELIMPDNKTSAA